MQHSSQKRRQQQKNVIKTKALSADLLLTSIIISSFVVATPLLLATTNNAAYAQTSGVTVDIECVLNDDGTAVVNWRIDNINSIKPATGTYGYEVFKGDQLIDGIIAAASADVFTDQMTKTFAGEKGQEYTLKVVINAEFDFEGGEVIASKTVTCPSPLTEQFQNQGQCIREANTNPSSGITKEECKAAFKA